MTSAFLLFLLYIPVIYGTASNSLSDCNAVAAKFDTTCGGIAASSVTAMTGVNVTCSSGFTSTTCPGTYSGSVCVFSHKLCVTCSGSSPVTIRVQSNGLPRYCPNVPVTLVGTTIDFTVNFNPDVNINSPVHNPSSASALYGIVCNISSQMTVPSVSNFVLNSGSASVSTLAGVSIDGVSIENVNSANNVDPFYPPDVTLTERVDACLGHPNFQSVYHYHMASGCAVNRPSGSISSCTGTTACNTNVSNYGISLFNNNRNLTVIGVAKDGHVIYGPYYSSGSEAAEQGLHMDDSRFGFIIMDTNEALFGVLHGNVRDVTMKFSVNLPKKRRHGGASSIRFARLRIEKRRNYIRKVSETAVQCFITDDKVNVDGIILANVADFNSELHQTDVFDPRIQAKILQQVTIIYGGEIGFNQAIELASETLGNIKFIQGNKILSQYFDEVCKDSGQYCCGLEDTLKKLEIGDIETLIIWENFDVTRYILRNNQTEEMKTLYLRSNQEKEKSYFQDKDTGMELEQVEQIRLVDWFVNNYKKFGIKLEIVTDKSQEGSQFVHGFDGIGDDDSYGFFLD
ncbi:unnamed protein product [Rotaria sp. Silwood1]|nr:unnamed protein product [Rotaria sp. Silwood1]CAF1600323.1 unnamed protein product [Rotaria sp. Silwood1]CAF4851681.1 unnamed protein product [Rotaria sp. Silwood1]